MIPPAVAITLATAGKPRASGDDPDIIVQRVEVET